MGYAEPHSILATTEHAVYDDVTTGRVEVGPAAALPDVPARMVKLVAPKANAQTVDVLGPEDAGGIPLEPGTETGWLPVDSTARLRVRGTAPDTIAYMVLR